MARPDAPTGISHESLREAIDRAVLLGLERSAYEAWTECTVLDPIGNPLAESHLYPATQLSYRGLDLLTRTPWANGARLLLRLIKPDASTGLEQCAVVHAVQPGNHPRWWRCSVRFVHSEDCKD